MYTKWVGCRAACRFKALEGDGWPSAPPPGASRLFGLSDQTITGIIPYTVYYKLHGYTVHQTMLKTYSLPTDAHNVKKHRVIKTF